MLVQLRIILILNWICMSTDSELNQTLHDQGRHLTWQRQLVMDILKEYPGHPDAGMIFQEAKKRDDRISLATVYRTLSLLKTAGLVEENHLGEDHGHFETIQNHHHYHFTCKGCGKVIEFEAPEIHQVAQTISEREKLRITGIQYDLQGYCPDCQKNESQE